MPIFVCDICNCLENTACSQYWNRKPGEPALCSLCDPDIHRWHGRFPGNNGMEILRGSVIEILKSLDIGISDKMSLRESREKPQQLRKVYPKRF